MIVAIDIETIGNPDTFDLLPTPEPSKVLKDPAKIAADIEAKQAAQRDKAALDPLTARVASFASVGEVEGKVLEYCDILARADDASERELLQNIFDVLGADDVRIVTWNGVGFDLPMIYKRALILGVDPAFHGAPPLSAWTKRYAADRHYDLMQIWCGWQGYAKLDTVAALVLGAKKHDFDVTRIADMIATDEGRTALAEYNLQDTRLTFELWKRFAGTLIA